MTIRRANPRKQGEIGLGAAIAWFLEQGQVLSIPLADNQCYDLVVDDGTGLRRVQVKTATARNASGNFVVALRTNGGNRSRQTTTFFDPDAVDLLFVLTDDRERYVIPAAAVVARSELSLGARCVRYRV